MTMPPIPENPPQPTLVFVDRVDLSETFVSSLRRWSIDGVNIHLEFAVNRPSDPVEPDGPPSIKIVTVARLVMPLSAVTVLVQALVGAMANLQRESPIVPTIQGPPTIN
jgi:hypothetical protein